MNRISKKFSDLKKRKEKALILYLTAGDPNLAKNEALIHAFEKEGVDLIELGVPFSDPLADGPVIQEASQRSLKKGTNLVKILKLVRKVRERCRIPILLMSYLNPILQYGIRRFAGSAKAAGVDGVIVPDLPPDEGKEIAAIFQKKQLDLVYLLAPTSTRKRIRFVARASRGFLYYVSVTGVTGIRRSMPLQLNAGLRIVKNETRLPVCVGFGISTPAQAQQMSKMADGVIVGSALVKALSAQPHTPPAEFSKKFVRPFMKALKKDPPCRRL